jgi:hypothetical protein
VFGIAALVAATAMALNHLYLGAVKATGTVGPILLRARWMANAGYLTTVVMLCLYNLWRVTHDGDLGWFWVVLNLVLAGYLTLVATRFVLVWLSGRRPDLDRTRGLGAPDHARRAATCDLSRDC